MKVAVLLSTYNGERYLRQQLHSILSQNCNAEMYVWARDDGSSDSTCKILEEYAKKGKLNWYKGENLKPAKSFLELLCNCKGYDYYAFADQDDIWYPDKLQIGIDHLRGLQGPAISCANARLVDANLEPLGRNLYTNPPCTDFCSILCNGGLLGCSMVFNDALARIVQEQNIPEKLIMHDYHLSIICTAYDGRIIYDHNPRLDYRQHGNNVVGTQWTKTAALKNRLEAILKRPKVSIAEMTQSILDQDLKMVSEEKLQFMRQVADYRRSFRAAIKMACSRQLNFNSRNMAVTMRLALLLRNR